MAVGCIVLTVMEVIQHYKALFSEIDNLISKRLGAAL